MKNIKKLLCTLVALAVIGTASTSAIAGDVEYEAEAEVSQEQDVNEEVDVSTEQNVDEEFEVFTLAIGQNSAKVFGEVKESDVAPIIRNNRTMLPARFVAENLGAEVLWDAENRIVTVKDDNVEIMLTIDSDIAVVNGVEEMLDSPAFIENSRTYTPVRFIAEKLGSTVNWDPDTQTVIMSKPVKKPADLPAELILNNYTYSYEAGGDIAEFNDGAIGGMNLSAELVAPAGVCDVLIAHWSDEAFSAESIKDVIDSMTQIWKQEAFEVMGADVPFMVEMSHPVDPEDMGKKMYVLLIGIDKDFNAVGYAVVEEVVGEQN